jgi:hypothetical protein
MSASIVKKNLSPKEEKFRSFAVILVGYLFIGLKMLG